ncbi:hypothetical protein [Nesterenkonia pannonica]|uniref:hypothetical protein n=1 Tax=Nesterenkonia pannonica TaxID=1548602 RepID=UPI0021648A94|nr:hypothetical protein [Nesterenkonia pannonica]
MLQFTTGLLEGRWPVRVSSTGGRFMTTHADRHHPLLSAEEPAQTVQALLEGIRGAREAGLVLMRHLPAHGPVAEAVAEAVRAGGFSALERVRLECAYAEARQEEPADGVIDVGHMSSKARKEFRRRVRAIEKQAGAPLTIVDRSEDQDLVEEFLDFQAAGWKGDPAQGGGAFRLDPHHERWCREVLAGFLEDDALLAPSALAKR